MDKKGSESKPRESCDPGVGAGIICPNLLLRLNVSHYRKETWCITAKHGMAQDNLYRDLYATKLVNRKIYD